MLGAIIPSLIGTVVSAVSGSPEAGQAVVDVAAQSSALTVVSGGAEVGLTALVGRFLWRKIPAKYQDEARIVMKAIVEICSAALKKSRKTGKSGSGNPEKPETKE